MITISRPSSTVDREGFKHTFHQFLLDIAVIRTNDTKPYLYIRLAEHEPKRVELTGWSLERTIDSQLWSIIKESGTMEQNKAKDALKDALETAATLDAIITTDQTAEDIRAILSLFPTTKTKGNIQLKTLKAVGDKEEQKLAKSKVNKRFVIVKKRFKNG